MSQVYLAGRALASALGPDLGAAMAALRRGRPAPSWVAAHTGPGPAQAWPFLAIADPADDDEHWERRMDRIVSRVAADSGALAAREGALFVASSSIDIGVRERSGLFEGDWQGFADRLAALLDWRGPVYFVNTACTSALNAMQSASALIRAGDADDALVLGVELRNAFTLTGFAAMQLLSPEPAQPLGASRRGLVLGEAVAALHLSSRRARWRVAGHANVVDGRNPAGAVASAIDTMCRQVLARSGLVATDIGLIKLQAAGSRGNDALEWQALQQRFQPLPPLVSLKAAIGHTMGAAGAAELALLAECLEAGVWPAVDYPMDDQLGAELIGRTPAGLRFVMACILGFGGGHAAVVLEDCAASATLP